MSGKEPSAAVFSHIVGVDLTQAINNVKSTLLSGQTETAFGFDLFKKHGHTLRALQELIDVVPKDNDSNEKTQRVQGAIESLVSDIGLPFLHSFAPSYDGRADSAAAVLNVCDFISVCLKRSSQKTSNDILELCLQSLVAFHNECSRHSESTSTLDVLCAIELLCTTLEIGILPENNQNDDLLNKVFSASLSVLSHLEEKKANRLISFVIIKLTRDRSEKKSAHLQAVWEFIEADVSRQNQAVEARSLQLHLTILCSMANFFFPLTDETVTPDIRQRSAFWETVHLGLYSDNPAVRKRSIYLVKRIVDTCEKSEADFIPVQSSLGDPFAVVPHFWWSKQHQKTLSKVWEDIFLLFETLDEKQTHVIKPILPRMQTLLNAAKIEKGFPALHTSWIVTVLMRAFHHESVFIMRWAAETVLFMDFTSMPLVKQKQLKFLTEKLLGFLQDLKLFQRPDGSPVGSCSSVGSGLKQFFASVCSSLDSKQDRADFVAEVLLTLRKENWSAVPLVFITQGLSCIPPDPLMDRSTLTSVREIINASLTTLETFTRGAIECFMTKTVLNLIDKSVVGVEDLMDTVSVMEKEESLQRGASLWSLLVSWLVNTATTATNTATNITATTTNTTATTTATATTTTATATTATNTTATAATAGDDQQGELHHPAWTWPALCASLHGMLDAWLAVGTDVSANVLSETLRANKMGRLAVLMADCEARMQATQTESEKSQGATRAAADGGAQPVLTAALGKAVEVVNSVNTRVYMAKLKADRAICLLLSCARELKQENSSKQDQCSDLLCRLVQACWSELLLYVKRRVLVDVADSEHSPVDLDLVVFYAEAVKTLGELLPEGTGVQSLSDLVISCVKVMDTPSASSSSTLSSSSLSSSSLQQVAAISLLSSVAQVVEVRLTQVEKGGGEGEDGVQALLSQLCTFFSAMTIDCNIFAADRGGGSAHQGRQVCQYMMCQWQCLRVVLSHRPHLLQVEQVLDLALDAFSVSSGETDIPLIQCLQLLIPQLVSQAPEHDERVVEALEVAWVRVQEEIKSWSFWLKMEALVTMVLQPPLLLLTSDPDSCLGGYMTKVMQRFFEVGLDKSGLLNLVMGRLCQLWTQGGERERGGGTALALTMVGTIVDACVFGTLHKKTERLWLDICMYIETLGEECSVNEIVSSSSKSDLYVRLMTLNFLSTLCPDQADHKALARAVLREMWGRYWSLAQLSTFRQFHNNLPHRQKHRLVQLLPLLDRFIDEDLCQEVCKNVWEGLVVECHPSVRQNLEWVAMRLFQRFPSQLLPFLWGYFDQFTDKRNISLLSMLHVVTHLGPELPEHMQADFYERVMPLVVPWTMAHHFNTRLHGQASLCQLTKQCQRKALPGGPQMSPVVSSCVRFLRGNGNSSAVLEKLMDNYFYRHFHFLRDYSMETLLYTLPRLSCLSDDEWMHPDLFTQLDPAHHIAGDVSGPRLLPLYNQDNTLAACEPGPWKVKPTAEASEDSTSAEGDVQKKVIPWRLMTPDSDTQQEYSCRKRGRRQDGLVLVTSLINKVPNLGGLCRTSEIFGVSEFVIGNLSYLNDRTFQSLSVTAEKWIPVTEVQWFRLSEFLEEKKRDSYTLVGVEQTANSVELTNYTFPKKTVLVLGNEKEGIPPDLLQQLDVCVEIPQQGIIRSLNVHVSGALLIWEYTRQQMEQQA